MEAAIRSAATGTTDKPGPDDKPSGAIRPDPPLVHREQRKSQCLGHEVFCWRPPPARPWRPPHRPPPRRRSPTTPSSSASPPTSPPSSPPRSPRATTPTSPTHIFRTLQDIDGDGNVQPDLATDLQISEDGLAYVYTLQEGQTCQDGEALTAEDVAYSFNRAKDPANAFTGNTPGFVFSSVGFDSAEAIDDTHVQINLAATNPIAFGLLTEVYVHCKDSYEAMTLDQAATTPVGSGSYRLASWTPGSEVVLEKVQDPGHLRAHRLADHPRGLDPLGRADRGQRRHHHQRRPRPGRRHQRLGHGRGRRRCRARGGCTWASTSRDEFAAMPGGDAIQDPAVRRALQYAIDVPAICQQLLNFECERATGLVNPPNDNPNLEPYPYDPAMAEKLLDEAGWPRGRGRHPLRRSASRRAAGRYLNDENVVLAIAQYLSDVGLDVELDVMEWGSVYVPLIRERNVGPLFFLGSGGAKWSALYDMTDLADGRLGHQLHPLGRPALVRPLGRHQRRRDARGAARHHRRDAEGLLRRRPLAAPLLPARLLRRLQPHQLDGRGPTRSSTCSTPR